MGNLLFWLCFVLLLFLFVCLFARLFVRLFCFVLILVVVLFLDFILFCSRLNEFMKPPDSLPTQRQCYRARELFSSIKSYPVCTMSSNECSRFANDGSCSIDWIVRSTISWLEDVKPSQKALAKRASDVTTQTVRQSKRNGGRLILVIFFSSAQASVPKTIFKTKIWRTFSSCFSQNTLMLSDSRGVPIICILFLELERFVTGQSETSDKHETHQSFCLRT